MSIPGKVSEYNLAEARRFLGPERIRKIEGDPRLRDAFVSACSGFTTVPVVKALGYDPFDDVPTGGPGVTRGGAGAKSVGVPAKSTGPVMMGGMVVKKGRAPTRPLATKKEPTELPDAFALRKVASPEEVQKRLEEHARKSALADERDRVRAEADERAAILAAATARTAANAAANTFAVIAPTGVVKVWLKSVLATWWQHRRYLHLRCDNWVDISTRMLRTYSIDVTVYNGATELPASKFVFHWHNSSSSHFKANIDPNDSRQDRLTDADVTPDTPEISAALAFARLAMLRLTPSSSSSTPPIAHLNRELDT
jgi:hypothetical protein